MLQKDDIYRVREMARVALTGLKNGNANGPVSAGPGTFNTLCGAIARRTGIKWETVCEIVDPVWDHDYLGADACARAGGLDQWPEDAQWHDWRI